MHDRWEKTSAKAKIPLGREFLNNGRNKDARKVLQKCLDADSEMPEAHILMGRLEVKEGRIAKAQGHFETALQSDDTSDEAYYWLGVITERQEEYQNAADLYAKAYEIQPDEIKYIRSCAGMYVALGEDDRAMELLTSANSRLASSFELKVVTADLAQRMGDTIRAIDLYREALMIEPRDTDVIAALGYCYIEEKEWQSASQIFEQLLDDSNGASRQAYLNLLAMCSVNSGNYGKAVKYYDELSVERRDDPVVWLKMGQAALGAKAANRAIECADRALRMKPGYAEAYALKGCALYVKKRYEESIRVFKNIRRDKSLGALAWMMTGRCYEKLSIFEKAEKAYDMARELNPDSKLLSSIGDSGDSLPWQ
ncbi:tetratricopeptide repeat protein [Anaerohalosphaera lusitana]|nr:tetratricopeptide repeat protein [Anaerohalosphaera lusitana]